jgi:hypothetical protein
MALCASPMRPEPRRFNSRKQHRPLRSGLRQLEIIKNNYGLEGEKVRLRWERGVFVPEGTASAPQPIRRAEQGRPAVYRAARRAQRARAMGNASQGRRLCPERTRGHDGRRRHRARGLRQGDGAAAWG